MELTLWDVDKRYGGKIVLSRFSHRFPPSGVVAVRGPSGCGKTTLLRLIAGLERPDGGKVLLSPGARISMLFQEDRLLPALTALENVLVPLGKPVPETVRRASRYLGLMGLEAEQSAYPDQLSGGMRRRVAVARALAYGGDLLLLDEPFKGLDPATRRAVLRAVFSPEEPAERLCILVTHDGEQADEVINLA